MRTFFVVLAAPLFIACTGSVQVQASASVEAGGGAPAPSAVSAEDQPKADSSSSITIRYAPPAVGKTITRKRENTLTAHLTSGKGMTLTVHTVSERTLKALAVTGDRVDKIEVKFVAEETTVFAGKNKSKSFQLPVAGRTFVLARGVVRPRVFAAEGVPASPKDSALVAQLVPRIDEDEGIENGGFPTGSIAVGDRVTTLERTLAWELARMSGAGTVRSLTIKLAELRDGASGREAVFAIDLAFTELQGDLRFDEQLTGTMVCRADGHLVSMKAKGPAVIEGPFGRADGTQEMTVTETE